MTKKGESHKCTCVWVCATYRDEISLWANAAENLLFLREVQSTDFPADLYDPLQFFIFQFVYKLLCEILQEKDTTTQQNRKAPVVNSGLC